VLPVHRSNRETENPHPVYASYMEERFSRVFARPGVRERVIPAYMGLIKQIDDRLGRLLAFLDAEGLTDSTLIVFTSDHGDYLGDHWLGEKELFHEISVKIPLIVVDPSKEADVTRGSVNDALVEAIDLAPTFLDAFGGAAKPHVLEGRSLLPLLRGEKSTRRYVISEYDYSMRGARIDHSVPVADCRMTMVFDGRWKFVHAEGFQPMLYDLAGDPDEFADLGEDPAFEDERARLREAMFKWARTPKNRITVSDDQVASAHGRELEANVLIGYWDEAEVAAARKKRKG
jgi:arylsulfatase A-like enzyme